jgi:putative ABC transport system permease protein
MTVYSDLEGKFSREFRTFGPNVIVAARQGEITAEQLRKIDEILAGKGDAVPVGYAVVSAGENKSPLVLVGTDLAKFRALNSSWQFVPDSYSSSAESNAFAGWQVQNTIPALKIDKPFAVSYGERSATLTPISIIHSGSEDDSRMFIELRAFKELTGKEPETVQLRVHGIPAEVEAMAGRLSASLPEAEVKPVRQITVAQTAVLTKIRAVVLAASAIVIVLIVVCMVATLTGSVLERRKDFAVMKALGASNSAVNFLFAGEATLLTLAGAILGFIVGSGLAYWIGQINFGAAITPRPQLLGPVVLGSIILALIAASAPLRLLRRIQPAGILRGE